MATLRHCIQIGNCPTGPAKVEIAIIVEGGRSDNLQPATIQRVGLVLAELSRTLARLDRKYGYKDPKETQTP